MPQPRQDVPRKLFEPLLHGVKLQHQAINAAVLVASDTIRDDGGRPDQAGTDRLRRNIRARRSVEGDGSFLRGHLEKNGVAVQTLLMFSDAIARAVLNTATEHEVSMIVLGMTGKNVFARLLAGNVPVEMIKNTKIPILLLPPDWNRSI